MVVRNTIATAPRTGDARERREDLEPPDEATSCRVLMAAALETPFRPREGSFMAKVAGVVLFDRRVFQRV
jgi:hypothetical protein